MYTFSQISRDSLATCHPDLQAIAETAIKITDFRVYQGFRGKEAQDKALAEGKSHARWPTSKHNLVPSHAFDFLPYKNGRAVAWDDYEAFAHTAGIFTAIAWMLYQQGDIKHQVRWGGHFRKLRDAPHLEII